MLKLRCAFVLIFASVVAMPLALFWAWPFSQAMHNEIEEVRERHLLIARNLGTALERYHADVTATFDFAAKALLDGRSIGEPQTLLSGLRFTAICLADLDSGTVSDGYGGLGRCPDRMEHGLAAGLIADPTMSAAAPLISGVRAEAGQAPHLRLLTRRGDRLVIGILDTGYFDTLGRSITFGVKGHAVIVDSAGRALSHPFPSWQKEMKDLSRISVVARMLKGETGVGSFYSPAYKDDMVAGFTQVKGAGWGVMVPQPVSELRDTAQRINRSVLGIVAIGLLISALVAGRAAMLLVRPLQQIIAAADKLTAGARGITVDVGGRGTPREIFALSRSFNQMSASISSAEAAEREARTAAATANESKSEFLRTVAHELRSPLNTIVGYTDLMVQGRFGPIGNDRYTACASDIRAASQHVLALTNDLLDLARVEAGQYELSEEVISVEELLARAARFAMPDAAARGIEIKHAPGAEVLARLDERAFFQCILNLVSNAVRYGRENGRIQLRVVGGPGQDLLIEVEDDGPGISAEDLQRVRQPFARVDNDRARDVRGTGLGLPIVEKLMRLMGGELVLESTVGKGTTARLVLPAGRVVEPGAVVLRTAA